MLNVQTSSPWRSFFVLGDMTPFFFMICQFPRNPIPWELSPFHAMHIVAMNGNYDQHYANCNAKLFRKERESGSTVAVA